MFTSVLILLEGPVASMILATGPSNNSSMFKNHPFVKFDSFYLISVFSCFR